MIGLLLDWMHWNDAPQEQYERLDLPAEGGATSEHLLCARHQHQSGAAYEGPGADYLRRPLKEIMEIPEGNLLLQRHPPAFQVMVKPCSALCNLDCSYCFYLAKEQLYPEATFRMSDALLEEYIRQYIAVQRGPEVVVAWQGGEPTLMRLEFYRKVVELQQKYRRPGTRLLNALQTNGTRLNDEWCAFFREHDFLIELSLDGPRALHDAYRVDKGGQPTFDRVMAGLALLKQHNVEFNILTCVHAANVEQPLEVYRSRQ